MKAQCPKCRQTYTLDAAWAGKLFKCGCGNVVEAPPRQPAMHRRPLTFPPPVRAEHSPFDFDADEPAAAIELPTQPTPAASPTRGVVSGRLAAGLAAVAAVAFMLETTALVVVLRRPAAAIAKPVLPRSQAKPATPIATATPKAKAIEPAPVPGEREKPEASAAIADPPPIVPAPVAKPFAAPVIKPAPVPESFKKLAKRRVNEWLEAVEQYRATVKAGGAAKDIETRLDAVVRATAILPSFSAEEPASDHGVYAHVRMVINNRLGDFLRIREILSLHGPMGARGTDGEFTDPASIRELAMMMPSE